ncbi:MAG: MFS transporter [Cyclobacteriaceae bacterium]|nr:MAG: MFS transporter [Cyclobacteriaceae bacterium]
MKIFRWSVTVALAGFLFGFDTAVISGADQPIQKLWQLSDLFHGTFIMSMALWGTVIGAMFGGIPCNTYGRKNTLIGIGVLYLVSALGSALAPDPYTFSIMRFIGGLGVGASSVAAPIYISEIAPKEKRGRLVVLYQFMLVLGIFVAYASNWLIGDTGPNAWRFMLGAEIIPAALYFAMIFTVSESPRWLMVYKHDATAARKLLMELNPDRNPDELLEEIQHSETETTSKSLWSSRYKTVIMLAFAVAFFNQLSGINFVIYYAPRILEATGAGASAALFTTAGIGLINIVFTMLGMYLIDRSGRRTLLIIGSIGYIVSLSFVARAFYTEVFTGVPILLIVFVAAHAIGQGAIIWVYISEIFPNQLRASGQAFGCSVHWVLAAIITLVMPHVLNTFSGGPIFAFFAIMMVLQLLFSLFVMPETKGISLEDLQKKLVK